MAQERACAQCSKSELFLICVHSSVCAPWLCQLSCTVCFNSYHQPFSSSIPLSGSKIIWVRMILFYFQVSLFGRFWCCLFGLMYCLIMLVWIKLFNLSLCCICDKEWNGSNESSSFSVTFLHPFTFHFPLILKFPLIYTVWPRFSSWCSVLILGNWKRNKGKGSAVQIVETDK